MSCLVRFQQAPGYFVVCRRKPQGIHRQRLKFLDRDLHSHTVQLYNSFASWILRCQHWNKHSHKIILYILWLATLLTTRWTCTDRSRHVAAPLPEWTCIQVVLPIRAAHFSTSPFGTVFNAGATCNSAEIVNIKPVTCTHRIRASIAIQVQTKFDVQNQPAGPMHANGYTL